MFAKLELSRVKVTPFNEMNRDMHPKRARLLTCFRPMDIVQRMDSYGVSWYTHVLLLLHEQDKEILDRDIASTEKLRVCLQNKNVSVLTEDARTYLEGMGIKVSYVLCVPLLPLPSTVTQKWIIDMTEKLSAPRVCLWLGPHVRKNSLAGFYATMDACLSYGSTVEVDVVCASSAVPAIDAVKELTEYIVSIPNVKINVHALPSEEAKFRIFARATTVILPSFDEGFNIPLHEAGRFKPDIVCTDIPVNREMRRCISSIRTVKTKRSVIIGSDVDEFSLKLHRVNTPEYSAMVRAIEDSLNDWKGIKKRKSKNAKNGGYKNPVKRAFIEEWSRFMGVGRRNSPGKGFVEDSL